jgi:AICAR transformylase/IMP cyclohydrolase PurH
MRYGENSHQQAAFYIEEESKKPLLRPRSKFRAKRFPITISPIPMRRWNA